GFGGLMDLLKACQREGLVRVERDRRGGLRVFQGPAMARAPIAPAQISTPASEPEAADTYNHAEPIEAEAIEPETVTVVDTTAELLGRAKPKRPRARATTSLFSEATAHGSLRGVRSNTKTASRKTAGTRRRTKKEDK